MGTRMQRIFETLGPGPVIIVGSDIPGITAQAITAAFQKLRGKDAILGPAGDGGYWLVGLRRRPRLLQPFRNVRWSGPHALADTMSNLSGSRVAVAGEMRDVDDAGDLTRESANTGRLILAPRSRNSN